MKYNATRILQFLKYIGRQDYVLFTGINAPCKKHWLLTRIGIRTAWVYATLVADIRFNRL